MHRDELLGDRYRLGPQIGSGGAATVYSAVDVLLGREVAVKLYRQGSHPAGRYRFGAEARLLAGLSHPGLITVYDVCLEDDQSYLVTRLVDGTTLRDLADHGPLDPTTVAGFGARIADVLAYIHAREVVHRDIKPSNVLIDSSGACYLADFGLARVLDSAHLTGSHEIVGTAAYLAPEQVTEVDTGPPVDVYALGLVLLECLTGQPEYTGTTAEVAVARLARQPRVPEGLPPRWRSLLTAMTARDPDARPDAASCAELLRAVSGATSVLPKEVPPRRGPRAVRAGLIVAGLAAAVAALTAGATTTVPGLPTESPRRTELDNRVEPVDNHPPRHAPGTVAPAPPARRSSPPVAPAPDAAPAPEVEKPKPDKPKADQPKPPKPPQPRHP
ncbi:MAG TPA: serine/threonine-protein kinase [Actinophytocola sp.]|nr:serine/threonine-protein kinase [Actinophytocola sp.]